MIGRLRRLGGRLRSELEVHRRVLADPRTPRPARWLLGAAVAYALSPVDLVPDWIPVLGYLDDALVVPLLAWLALRLVPPEVVSESRGAVRREAGVDE
ncbi:MAG TPA: YkvA family protein [Gammaproteobacteria bacterium]|nr:YkvA family protein [Gammaproteobacteria bacterium]